MKHLLLCLIAIVAACCAHATEINKGEKYVIKRDDTVAFTTHKMAMRYSRALEEGQEPAFVGGHLSSVGGGGITPKHEYKQDVLRAAGKSAKKLKRGKKVEAVSEKEGVVCVKLNKKTKVYVWCDELMPLADYETITNATKPISAGKGILKNAAFLFEDKYTAREYVQLAKTDADTAVEWADAKRKSRDARLFDGGVKFIVVTVDGELAKITMEHGEVFWCRCADIAMQ